MPFGGERRNLVHKSIDFRIRGYCGHTEAPMLTTSVQKLRPLFQGRSLVYTKVVPEAGESFADVMDDLNLLRCRFIREDAALSITVFPERSGSYHALVSGQKH